MSVQTIFDPRINLESGESKRQQIVWTSENVEWARGAIELGKPLKASPFVENKPPLRKSGLVYQYTDDEINEIARCMIDIEYFANKHCMLMTGEGTRGHISLYDHQVDQLRRFYRKELNKHIMLWSRQGAKTTTTAIYMTHQLLFTIDTSIAVLANKGGTSGEVISKVKEIYKNIPFFMQQGIVGWNGGGFSLDNGCNIFSGPTTFDALNGKTCRILYLDEFSFAFDGNTENQRLFLANAQPVLSSFRYSKLIISSTPNGRDFFHSLFDNAVKGKNGFDWTKIYWYQIPGRTQKWADDIKATIGEDMFKIQYELSFDLSVNKLLANTTMVNLASRSTTFSRDEYEKLIVEAYPDTFKFKPNACIGFKDDPFRQSFMLITSDLAEGLELDHTTMQGLEVRHDEPKPDGTIEIWFDQVFTWNSNTIGLPEFANILGYTINMFDQEKVRLLVESNKYGEQLMAYCDVFEDENIEIEHSTWLMFKRSKGAKYATRGLLTNKAIKNIGVRAFKTIMDADMFMITESSTVDEIDMFQEHPKKPGIYKAVAGHDDLVTPLVNASFAMSLNSVGLRELIEDYLEYHHLDEYEWKYKANLTKIKNPYDDSDESE